MAVSWKTVAGVSVALILGGCVTDERPAAVGSEVAKEAAPNVPPQSAQLAKAPNVTFTDLTGKPVELATLQGKVVYIDFWAPWCPPCRAGLPFTDRLDRSFKDKGLVVLAASDDPAKTVKPFLKSNHYGFRTVLDSGIGAQAFDVNGIPHTIVIDRTGHIVAEEEGLVPQAETIGNLSKAGLDMTGFEPKDDPTAQSG